MHDMPKPLLELLKPFEAFLHAGLDEGPLRSFFFQLFRMMHIYLYEYPDYLLFGVIAIPIFYLIPRKGRVHYLILASFTMIGILYGSAYAACLLLFPLAIHFLVVRIQARALGDAVFRRRAIGSLAIFVLAVYGILLAKESYDWIWKLPLGEGSIIIPLLHVAGIAFMLPKLLHYIVDSLQGKIRDAKASHFALFMIFFPILRLGPIERFQFFTRDILSSREHGVSSFDIQYGLWRIGMGVLKTMLFTGYFYGQRLYAADHIGDLSIPYMYWILIGGPMEIYCHFGGYTDIALGFSRLLGFKSMENFYMPILSENLAEQWRRWHISLSFWLRDYVFLPLGGSKKRGLINVSITFFICGAWHNIAWNFIIWGVLQAVGLTILQMWKMFWRQVGRSRNFMKPLKPLLAYMQAHPRLSYMAGVFVTAHYFAITGLYFVLSVDGATYAIMRFFTLGWYHRGG